MPRLLFADAETYWDVDYTLRKLTTAEYVLDSRFEEHGWAVAVDRGPSHWVDGPDMPRFLSEFDPADTVFIAFNTLFDGGIVAWRHGWIPRMFLDTMGMARAIIGHKLREGASLAAVARALGLPAKGDTVAKTKGLRRQQLIQEHPAIWQELQAYANNDNERNRDIFFMLAPFFPASERRLMDLVLRCGIEPVFQVDRQLLADRVEAIQAEKAQLLVDCGLSDRKALMSATQFGEALTRLGIELEYKVSPATGRKIPALAKTDDFMNFLLEHPDSRVQTLAAARVGHRSTIEETRAQRFIRLGNLAWPSGEPALPVPLRYAGAHTHRLSGTDSLNLQNMTKGSALRFSIIVKKGYVIIVADLSQIEARLTAWLARCLALLKQFAEGLDPYSIMASHVFGFQVDKNVHKVERFIGKIAVLGLGYGCGWARFYAMVRQMARLFKIDLGDMWTETLAEQTVGTYRRLYFQIPALWRDMSGLLEHVLLSQQGAPYQYGPVTFVPGQANAFALRVGGCAEIVLPNGLGLRYDNLRRLETGDIVYDYGRMTGIRIHGPKATENVVQALARLVVMEAAERLDRRGLRFRLQAHDELVFKLPVEGGRYTIDEARGIISTEMTRQPAWVGASIMAYGMPALPLAVDVSKPCLSYGDAK